jgi:hypothetical protein
VRRLATVSLVLVLGLALAACATPPIRLSQAWRLGDERTYLLTADATTTVDVTGTPTIQHTTLRARSVLTVVGVEAGETRVRLRLEPEAFAIDGVPQDRPSQEVELVVGPAGDVVRVESVGGLPADLVGDVEDLAPLLGAPLPTELLHLGDRWERPVTPPEGTGLAVGRQVGRVGALRVVGGRDCAIIRLTMRRPIARNRTVGGQQLALVGNEFSASEIAFAFRDGFPMRIDTEAEGRFRAISQGFVAGSVEIVQTSALRLLSARGGAG